MSPLQFSLFFVALLIAYGLVHIRLVRFERYLKEIAGLRTLNDRLQRVSTVLEGFRLDRVESRLDRVEELLGQVHEELRELNAATVRVERGLSTAGTVAVAAADHSVAETIRATVESRLLGMGFSDVHILSDLSEVATDRDLEVVVECVKAQMRHKGKVLLGNGVVRDVDLRSIAQSFP